MYNFMVYSKIPQIIVSELFSSRRANLYQNLSDHTVQYIELSTMTYIIIVRIGIFSHEKECKREKKFLNYS